MILLVGGAGYIGSHVNKLLSSQGYKTVILDNLSTGHRDFVKWGIFEFGDLSALDHIRKVFERYPISAVMHFAAHAYVEESVRDPQKYYLNNFASTLNLLRVMLERNVLRLVFSSSCAIYGTPENMPIHEGIRPEPINPYGQSKLMVERVLQEYCRAYGLQHVALRYFNAAGADSVGEIGEWHDPEPHIIPRILDVAAGRSDSLTIYGTDYPTIDGTCIRDYVHVEDIAQGHLLALQYLQSFGASTALNLGTGNGYSVRQLVDMVQLVTGCSVPCHAADRRLGDPAVLVAEYTNVASVLGWQPRKSLEEIIASAWRWQNDGYGKLKNMNANG